MRIAVLGIKSLPAKAGADRVVEKLLENYSRSNEYYIYLMNNGNGQKLSCDNNLHYIYMPFFGGKHLKAFSYFFFCSLHYLFKNKYDVAHIHNSDFGLFTNLIKIKRNAKIIGTFHGDPYLRAKWSRFAKQFLIMSEYFFIKNADLLTTVARSKVQKINGRKKIVFLPNGLEKNTNDNNDPEFVEKTFGVKKHDYFLFACGRLDSTKGLHHLIDAYMQGDFDHPLLVIGDFSHDKMYSKKIEAVASRNKNIILKKELLSKEDLLNTIKNAKIFVFPSEVEAMSMVLLEAISCSVPVICSDIEENIDIVGTDYKYRFQNKNASDLLEKINSAINDEQLDSCVTKLHVKVEKDFDWKEIAEKYEQLYCSIITR